MAVLAAGVAGCSLLTNLGDLAQDGGVPDVADVASDGSIDAPSDALSEADAPTLTSFCATVDAFQPDSRFQPC